MFTILSLPLKISKKKTIKIHATVFSKSLKCEKTTLLCDEIMGFCHTFPFALQLNKNFAKLRHSPFKNFLSFKSLLGWSLRFFLGFSFFQQSNWWTKQAVKPVFSPLCWQVFVTCCFFTLFYPSGKKLLDKNFESGAKAAT